eukprot:2867788-Rhodomonas_salina.1
MQASDVAVPCHTGLVAAYQRVSTGSVADTRRQIGADQPGPKKSSSEITCTIGVEPSSGLV